MKEMKANSGLTLKEAIVAVVVVIVLLSGVTKNPVSPERRQMTEVLSNMKQLHLVTQQSALDGATLGDTNLGWPGDLGGSFARWSDVLVPEYLTTNDFAKLLTVPGKRVGSRVGSRSNTNGILVYAVRESSAPETVLFSSANFTNTVAGGVAPLAGAVPFGEKGFVVFRKGGDGVFLRARQAGDTNVVGAFAPLCE